MPATNRPSSCSIPTGAAGATSNPSTTPTGLRVLIIDDDPSIRHAVGRLLRRVGHGAEVAANGPEALALARANAFELIICDLNMPGWSGLEVYRALHREQLLGGSWFVLATGEGAEPRSVALTQGEPLPVLAKPFALAELLEVVNSLPRHAATDGAGQ